MNDFRLPSVAVICEMENETEFNQLNITLMVEWEKSEFTFNGPLLAQLGYEND